MLVFVAAIVSICLAHTNGQCTPRNDPVGVPEFDNTTGLYQGDIYFTKEQMRSLKQGHTYNVLHLTDSRRWVNPGVYGAHLAYEFTDNYTEPERRRIVSALSDLSALTGNCIRIVERTTEKEYVKIGYRAGGCWSRIGRSRQGHPQSIGIGSGCTYSGIVQHEFLHTLGFWHEHSRPDRDTYITVHWENINKHRCYNFPKESWQKVTTYGQPYDYGSVMHYSALDFSFNYTPTIVPKSTATVGQRYGASQWDIAKLKALYRC